MSVTQTSKAPAFRLLDLHVSEIDSYPNAIQDMLLDRNFEGMIIRDVLPKNKLEEIISHLEDEFMQAFFISPTTMVKDLPYKCADMFGQSIIGSTPDLGSYFTCAAPFRQACRQLFGEYPDFESHLESVFCSLAGGLPIQIPTGPNGQTYTPATIRVLPEEHEILLHVGNEFLRMPQATHLNTLVDLTDQLSYFIPLSIPESGGELIVYNLEWNPEEHHDTPETPQLAEHLLQQSESMIFAPGPGDMLLFDGGRFYHCVTPVVGAQPRRTIGGFLALSKDHDSVYYWS